MILEAVVAVATILGSALCVIVGISLFRHRDALSRINAMGPATALGIPLVLASVLVAHWMRYGFDAMALAKTVATIVALVIVSSVASNVLARATYLSGAPLDPRTNPNDLDED